MQEVSMKGLGRVYPAYRGGEPAAMRGFRYAYLCGVFLSIGAAGADFLSFYQRFPCGVCQVA